MEQENVLLLRQLVELQKENIELRKDILHGRANTSQTKRMQRPSIGLDSTDSEWALFLDTWYKEMCRLENPAAIRNELREACTPETNRLLFELVGPERLNNAAATDEECRTLKELIQNGFPQSRNNIPNRV